MAAAFRPSGRGRNALHSLRISQGCLLSGWILGLSGCSGRFSSRTARAAPLTAKDKGRLEDRSGRAIAEIDFPNRSEAFRTGVAKQVPSEEPPTPARAAIGQNLSAQVARVLAGCSLPTPDSVFASFSACAGRKTRRRAVGDLFTVTAVNQRKEAPAMNPRSPLWLPCPIRGWRSLQRPTRRNPAANGTAAKCTKFSARL